MTAMSPGRQAGPEPGQPEPGQPEPGQPGPGRPGRGGRLGRRYQQAGRQLAGQLVGGLRQRRPGIPQVRRVTGNAGQVGQQPARPGGQAGQRAGQAGGRGPGRSPGGREGQPQRPPPGQPSGDDGGAGQGEDGRGEDQVRHHRDYPGRGPGSGPAGPGGRDR
jgi:hypothetical protein